LHSYAERRNEKNATYNNICNNIRNTPAPEACPDIFIRMILIPRR
jgi:hypothetical protein